VDRRKRQTATAIPAKPGGLPLTLAVLREDDRAIVRAASQASKAADFLLGFLPGDTQAHLAAAATGELEAA
jgi:antirestriction protein ArdC